MVDVQVVISATDNVDALPQCSLKSVVVTGGYAGDGVVTGTFTASVRAEKDYAYTLKVACRDAAGNTSYASTTVCVTNKDAVATPSATAKGYLSRGSSR
jgi:hypothetical protein